MASIGDLLQQELIIDDLRAVDKGGAISEFARLLQSAGKVQDADELVRVLMEREALGSTGIGDGIAIPHAKLPFLREMIVAFGKSDKGVDFQSVDGKPAHLFFLLVTPDDNPGEHLRTLARISRILKNRALRDQLMKASRPGEIQRLISEEDSKYPQK
jgi:PTS system nitrogen regulatory IIA component